MQNTQEFSNLQREERLIGTKLGISKGDKEWEFCLVGKSDPLILVIVGGS